MTYENIRPSGGDTGSSLNLRKRMSLIQNVTEIKGKKFLDCGCGSGQYVQACLNSGADAYGIEYESEKVVKFKRENPDIADRVNAGDIEAIAHNSDTFDVVLLNEVLEHVPNEAKALKEVYRVLKPGGKLVIFSPNRLYPFETHSVWFKGSKRQLPICIPFIPYIPLFLGKGVFDYVARNYWPHQLAQLARDSGLTVIKTGFVWQTFENISGSQPILVSILKPFLRAIFTVLERIPGINVFGISRMIVAQK
jgi:ubiquinone/menaquinone biosynthesis C-methylase UbiE